MSDPVLPEGASSAAAPPKKTTNSYYYWHGHEKERAAVGDVAPMPVPVMVSKDEAERAAEAEAIRKMANLSLGAAAVKKYSWSDGSKFVSVYITTAEAAAEEPVVEGSVGVEYTKASFSLTFQTLAAGQQQPKGKKLALHLSKRIDPAKCVVTVRPEKREILLKLAKEKVPDTWVDLVGNAPEEEEEEAAGSNSSNKADDE